MALTSSGLIKQEEDLPRNNNQIWKYTCTTRASGGAYEMKTYSELQKPGDRTEDDPGSRRYEQ
jgi:hypothetical protein